MWLGDVEIGHDRNIAKRLSRRPSGGARNRRYRLQAKGRLGSHANYLPNRELGCYYPPVYWPSIGCRCNWPRAMAGGVLGGSWELLRCPILDLQPAHPPEFTFAVCHQCEPCRHGVRCNSHEALASHLRRAGCYWASGDGRTSLRCPAPTLIASPSRSCTVLWRDPSWTRTNKLTSHCLSATCSWPFRLYWLYIENIGALFSFKSQPFIGHVGGSMRNRPQTARPTQ